MKKIIFFALSLLATDNLLFAQTTFQKVIHNNDTDDLRGMTQSPDSGYVILEGFNNYYIEKLDHAGKLVWSKVLGKDVKGVPRDIVSTRDGGYAIAGSIGLHMALIKLKSNGKLQWSKVYYKSKGSGSAFTITESTDGGFLLSGSLDNKKGRLIFKTDSLGNLQWSQNVWPLGGLYDIIKHVVNTPDSGYVMVRNLQSDIYLIKLDSKGNLQWVKSFGDSITVYSAVFIRKASDNGFIIAGSVLIKTDSLGNLQWSKKISSSAGTPYMESVIPSNNKTYIAAGIINAEKDFGYPFLVKFNNAGNIIWTREIHCDIKMSGIEHVHLGRDYDGFMLACPSFSSSDFWNNSLIKFNSQDTSCMAMIDSGTVTDLGGTTLPQLVSLSPLTLHVASDTNKIKEWNVSVTTVCSESPEPHGMLYASVKEQSKRLNVYPNPAQSKLTIEINIDKATLAELKFISLEGKIVKKISASFISGLNIQTIDINRLQAGMYTLQINTGREQLQQKFIKQ